MQPILLWQNKKGAGILAATINLLFILICLFGYSSLSLVFLFCQFLTALGITLHLLYIGFSESEYIDFSEGQKNNAPDEAATEDSNLDDSRDRLEEHVSPDTIQRIVVFMYEVLLRLYAYYNDLVTLKSVVATASFYGIITCGAFIVWFLNIPASFILWIATDIFLLYPLIA